MIVILKKELDPKLREVKNCLSKGYYHAALCLSLTLPDVCSYLELPEVRGRSRYMNWIEKYYTVLDEYNGRMKSGDIYALRCSYLHNGSDVVEMQKAKEVVSKFRFIYSVHNNLFHRNTTYINDYQIMQLDIKKFCEEIIDAVNNFIKKNNNNSDIYNRAVELMNIENDRMGIIF